MNFYEILGTTGAITLFQQSQTNFSINRINHASSCSLASIMRLASCSLAPAQKRNKRNSRLALRKTCVNAHKLFIGIKLWRSAPRKVKLWRSSPLNQILAVVTAQQSLVTACMHVKKLACAWKDLCQIREHSSCQP